MIKKLSLKLSLLNFRQKLALFLFFLVLLFIPLTLFALKKKTTYRGRAEEAEDPRTLVPSEFYLPFVPSGRAKVLDPDETPSQWLNTIELVNLSGESNDFEIKFYDSAGNQVSETVRGTLVSHGTMPGLEDITPPDCQGETQCLFSAVIKTHKGAGALVNLLRSNAYQYSTASYEGISRPSTLHLLPFLRDEQGWNQEDQIRTFIHVFNPNPEVTNVKYTQFREDGSVVYEGEEIPISPWGSYQYTPYELGWPGVLRGAARITSDQPTAAVVLHQSEKRMNAFTSSLPSDTIYLPFLVTNPGWPGDWTGLLQVQNASMLAKNKVTIKHYQRNGDLYSQQEVELEPGGFYGPPWPPGFEQGMVAIESEQPVAAVVARESTVYLGGGVSNSQLSDLNAVPFVAWNGGSIPTKTSIFVFNPNLFTIKAYIDYYTEIGENPRTHQAEIAPFSFNKFEPVDFNLPNGVGSALVRAKRVESNSQAKALVYIEGLREIRDSELRLVSGDGYLTFLGQPLLAGLPPPPPLIDPCEVDFNEDGIVDKVDLEMISSRWRAKKGDPNYDEKFDLNKDDVINIVDIQIVASQIGKTCERITATPPPAETFCPPECEQGLPRRMGNAVCDGVIDDKDYYIWLFQYKIYQGGEIMAPEERVADFYCDPNNPSSQVVDLADFEFWRRNAYRGVIPTPVPPCPNPDYCFDPSFCPPENQHPEFSCQQANLVCCLYLTPTPKLTLPPIPPPSAFFFLSPSGGYYPKEENFEVFVNIDTGGEETTSADAILLFDREILEAVEVSPGNFYPQNFKEIFPGKVYVGGAVEDKEETRSGSGILAKVTFKGENEGSVSVRFDCTPGRTDDSNITASDAGATDILDCSKIVNGTYIISEPIYPPTPTPTSEPSPLFWEAEDGVITFPFIVREGYVYQFITTKNPLLGGRASYRFNLATSGDYIVRAVVDAPDDGSDSFFVNIDSEPTTSMDWHIPITNGFEERTVTWGGSPSPQVFTLSAGEHELIFRGRESDTKLDKIKIEPLPTPGVGSY